MNGIIYYIFNIESGKGYIGKHCKPLPDGRFRAHSRSKSLIGNSIRKYGINKFKVVILDYGSFDEELWEKEKFWIDYLNTISPNGYNLSVGGQGISGYKSSEESVRAMKLALTGKPWSEARRKALVYRVCYRKLTDEQVLTIRNDKVKNKYELAQEYGVTDRTIRDIKSNRTFSTLKAS